MNSWTTCFVAALAVAGAGALWLTLGAPQRSDAVAGLASSEERRATPTETDRTNMGRTNMGRGDLSAGANTVRPQRLSAASD